MNKFTKFASLCLVGMLAASFSACSDDEEIVTPTPNPTPGTDSTSIDTTSIETNVDSVYTPIATQYVNNVVFPTYSSLATHATELYAACVTMQEHYNAGTLTQADVDAACDAFKGAREQWELSEAWLYGAASDYEIDPHIDSWPLDQTQMANFLSDATMVAGLHSSDPIGFINDHNGDFDTALGFHGLEFVLFRDGANRPVAAFSGNETHSSFAGKTVSCAEEIAFLVAVSGDLRNHTYWLEAAWEGTAAPHYAQATALGYTLTANNGNGLFYGADMLQAGTSASTQASKILALVTILESGCSNICQEVYTQKLGQAYNVATGKVAEDEENSINYIESPYSHRSFIDYQDNIKSIRNSLYGSLDGTINDASIIKLLENSKYANTADLKSKLEAAIASLDTCMQAPGYFVANPGHENVGKAITAINELDDALNAAKTWISKL